MTFRVTQRVNGGDIVTFTDTKVNRDSSITIALSNAVSNVSAVTIGVSELFGLTSFINHPGAISKSVFISSTAINRFVARLTNAFSLVCYVFTIQTDAFTSC